MTAIKILFLAANPRGTERLALDEELRAIKDRLQRAELGGKVDLQSEWALRVDELPAAVMRHKPDIVHISGHGSAFGELLLHHGDGGTAPVAAETLSRLFALLGSGIRCVFLNACYSEIQASAIATAVPAVIGMSRAVEDVAAIAFAASFYEALAFGKPIQAAFDLACVGIELAQKGHERLVPRLLLRSSDVAQQVLLPAGASSGAVVLEAVKADGVRPPTGADLAPANPRALTTAKTWQALRSGPGVGLLGIALLGAALWFGHLRSRPGSSDRDVLDPRAAHRASPTGPAAASSASALVAYQPKDVCQPSQVKGLFKSQELPLKRILIANLVGANVGPEYQGVNEDLERYVYQAIIAARKTFLDNNLIDRNAIDRLVKAGNIQDSALAKCVIESHAHARQIGAAAGADVVLWGDAQLLEHPGSGNGSPIAMDVNVSTGPGAQIGSNNQITAGPGAHVQTGIVINNNPTIVQNPDYEVWFDHQLRLTLVRWQGHAVAEDEDILWGPIALQEMEFPKIHKMRGMTDGYAWSWTRIISSYESGHPRFDELKGQLFAIGASANLYFKDAAPQLSALTAVVEYLENQSPRATAKLAAADTECPAAVPACGAEVAYYQAWLFGQQGDAAARRTLAERALQRATAAHRPDIERRARALLTAP